MSTSRLIKASDQLLSFVDSLLLPLTNMTLLLPVSAMVEVVETKIKPADDMVESWFSGWASWQGNKLPLICFENLLGEKSVEIGESIRCVIMKRGLGDDEVGYYAVMTQGYPRSIRVTPTSDFRVETDAQEQVGVLMRAKFEDAPIIMPDLEQIERSIHELVDV